MLPSAAHLLPLFQGRKFLSPTTSGNITFILDSILENSDPEQPQYQHPHLLTDLLSLSTWQVSGTGPALPYRRWQEGLWDHLSSCVLLSVKLKRPQRTAGWILTGPYKIHRGTASFNPNLQLNLERLKCPFPPMLSTRGKALNLGSSLAICRFFKYSPDKQIPIGTTAVPQADPNWS